MQLNQKSRWPKIRPSLTDEQQRIFLIGINIGYPKQASKADMVLLIDLATNTRLELSKMGVRLWISAPGNGAHLKYEDLESQEYIALEYSSELIGNIKKLYPKANAIIGDCQKEMDFQDNYFDRVLAIHVLEHLDNLPVTLRETHRILRLGGKFSVIIPCEGGMLYSIGRKFSSEKMFVERYHQSYDWLIKYDHINTSREVLSELNTLFNIDNAQYFPFLIPNVDMELVIGLTCSPRK